MLQDDKVDYSRYYMKNREIYSDNASENHSIEYTGKRDTKRAKPKTKKGNIKGTILTISIVIVMFMLTILIADSIKGGYVVSEIEAFIKGSNKVESTYYGVEAGVFEDIESARLYANDIRQKSGAGYVVCDNGYHVLVEVYADKNDADSIAKKLKLDGENAKVYPFKIKRIDYMKFPEKTRNAVKATIAYNARLYKSMYAIALDLAERNIDDNAGKMRVQGLLKETRNVIAEFVSNVDNTKNNANIVKVKAELESIEAMLENLAGDTIKRPNFLADVRYTSCLIVSAYRGLSEEID